jgi:hypothetical protein
LKSIAYDALLFIYYCSKLDYILFDVLLYIVRYTFAVFMTIYQRQTFCNYYALDRSSSVYNCVQMRMLFAYVARCYYERGIYDTVITNWTIQGKNSNVTVYLRRANDDDSDIVVLAYMMLYVY